MLASPASLYMLWHVSPEPVFWIGLLSVSLGGLWVPQHRLHWIAPLTAGVAILMLPAAHVFRFGASAMTFAGTAVNVGWLAIALILIVLAMRNKSKPGKQPFAEAIGM